MYRGELETLALPLEDKATEALEKALEKAYELGVYSQWTLAAQDQVNRFRPGAYAQVRQVDYRPSDSMVRADLARQPDGAEASVAPAPAAPQQPAAPATPEDKAAPSTGEKAPAPTASLGEVLP
jgi:hypothetical protein